MIGKIIMIGAMLFIAFLAGMLYATPEPVEKGIQMTPAESCNSLIKAEANGVYDPWTGLMFIRTESRTEEAIYHTILHEIGHYHFGLDENLAETFAVNHKIIEVDLNE